MDTSYRKDLKNLALKVINELIHDKYIEHCRALLRPR